MKYDYKDKSRWLLNRNLMSITQLNGRQVARLNSPCQFKFSDSTIKDLRKLYLANEEKGGLILFDVTNGEFRAVEVVVITNVASNKRTTYRADGDELDAAFRSALDRKLIPLDFHTHPTAGPGNEVMFQSFNFLQQLNTSIQDQASTRWAFHYNGIPVRLPGILYVENASMSFIGLYGGLIAPLCFTAEKDKTVQQSMEKALDSFNVWAEKPGNKGLAILGGLTLLFLAFRYPKVVLPTIACAGAVLPPLMYASREDHKYFGISHGNELVINLPQVTDSEIADHEIKAIAAADTIKLRKQQTPQIA